jgi:hypothetical protein
MSYERLEQKRQHDPLVPLLGFVLLLLVSILAYFAAPGIARWLETTEFSFLSFGQVLPIDIPDAWPDIVVRLVIAGAVFLFVFTILMVVLMLVMKPPKGEYDIGIQEVRAKKGKRKGGKRRR